MPKKDLSAEVKQQLLKKADRANSVAAGAKKIQDQDIREDVILALNTISSASLFLRERIIRSDLNKNDITRNRLNNLIQALSREIAALELVVINNT